MSTAPSTQPVARHYSKSSAFYRSTKKDFFADNDALLSKAVRQNRLYAQQPIRSHCKLCQHELAGTVDFSSHGVDYLFCPACSHLNGSHEDTRSFVEALYITSGGSDYSSNYIDFDFEKRTADIYAPKVDFLLDGLPAGPHRVLDVGCGSGYFVHAALRRDLPATGIDVSQSMVDFGNRQLQHLTGCRPLRHVDENAFFDAIVETAADVISAMGVIEHLREPQRFFAAFRQSRARWLCYSVPMFSLSVILEGLFKEVFPRQLSGGHTHLFTEDSIRTLNALLGSTPVSEWRFGTDMMDLYRSAMITLQKSATSPALMAHLECSVGPQLDALQSVLDQSHFCSEIHCLVAKA
jgi:SAM-dependent methyltransferase